MNENYSGISHSQTVVSFGSELPVGPSNFPSGPISVLPKQMFPKE